MSVRWLRLLCEECEITGILLKLLCDNSEVFLKGMAHYFQLNFHCHSLLLLPGGTKFTMNSEEYFSNALNNVGNIVLISWLPKAWPIHFNFTAIWIMFLNEEQHQPGSFKFILASKIIWIPIVFCYWNKLQIDNSLSDNYEMTMRWLWDDYELTVRWLWEDSERTVR